MYISISHSDRFFLDVGCWILHACMPTDETTDEDDETTAAAAAAAENDTGERENAHQHF